MRRWWVCLVATALMTSACADDDGDGTGAESRQTPVTTAAAPAAGALERFPVPAGSGPHEVAPAPDGTVWYTAQRTGALGRLDPATKRTTDVPLGTGSAPHGVIVGPDGAAWVTDSGLNAIVRVDATTNEVKRFPLPANRAGANLNTAVFDRRGMLWFRATDVNASVAGSKRTRVLAPKSDSQTMSRTNRATPARSSAAPARSGPPNRPPTR